MYICPVCVSAASVHRQLRMRRLGATQVVSGCRFQGATPPMRLIGWSAMQARGAPSNKMHTLAAVAAFPNNPGIELLRPDSKMLP